MGTLLPAPRGVPPSHHNRRYFYIPRSIQTISHGHGRNKRNPPMLKPIVQGTQGQTDIIRIPEQSLPVNIEEAIQPGEAYSVRYLWCERVIDPWNLDAERPGAVPTETVGTRQNPLYCPFSGSSGRNTRK